MSMDRNRVAKTWIFRGLCDLYFAFACNDTFGWTFEDYERFAEISGFEKFQKALILFHRHHEYDGLGDVQAREKLNKMAKTIGHDFAAMLQTVASLGVDIAAILGRDFDGYKGSELVKAVQAGYMETRYPVPKPISDAFPIPEAKGFAHDPLSSSGITKFIYALCNACIFALSAQVDFSDVIKQFGAQYPTRESFQRFNNIFWEERCKALFSCAPIKCDPYHHG